MAAATTKRTHTDTALASSDENTSSTTQQKIRIKTAPPTDEVMLPSTAQNCLLPHAQIEKTVKQTTDIGLHIFNDELDKTMQTLFNEQHDFNLHEIMSKQFNELQCEDQSLTKLEEAISEQHDLTDYCVSCYVNVKGLLAHKFSNYNNRASYNVIHQIVVSKCLRGKILKLAHNVAVGGHEGIAKTRNKIL